MRSLLLIASLVIVTSVLVGCGERAAEPAASGDAQAPPAVSDSHSDSQEREDATAAGGHSESAESAERPGEKAAHADEELGQAEADVAALPASPNEMCPMMTDREVDPALFYEHNDRRVYVCCERCLMRGKSDPAHWYDQAYGDERDG